MAIVYDRAVTMSLMRSIFKHLSASRHLVVNGDDPVSSNGLRPMAQCLQSIQLSFGVLVLLLADRFDPSASLLGIGERCVDL